jgi:hypothetical protein
MTNGRPRHDVEFDAARFARVENGRRDGCLCHRASLDDVLSDDMMAPVLRSAGYEPNEFREMLTEIACKGEQRCSCD